MTSIDTEESGPSATPTATLSSPAPAACAAQLSPGCVLSTHTFYVDGEARTGPVIWVGFAPRSRENPFLFPTARKVAITAVAVFFTFITAFTTSAYEMGETSMCAELGCTRLQVEAGLGLYCWGFAMFPLVLAPISEELGRRWTYAAAVVVYWLLHLMMTLGKNTGTVLVCRFLLGASGSIGATLVGGTIADIYVPEKRGVPMALFGLCAVIGTGLGGVTMCWVEVALGWRWIQWIQFIVLGAFVPIVLVVMRETRATVVLRRKAAALRRARGAQDGAVYMARSEVDKEAFWSAMRTSLFRPLLFLATEPVVLFFSLWIAIGWGVLYTQIGGLPYIFQNVYGFNTTQVGSVYAAICIGSLLGFCANFVQERVYVRQAPSHGVEARLYAPMVAGITFAVGCFVFGFTSAPPVSWVAPCVGIVIIIASIILIYTCAFTFLAQCYGPYASSAIAGQSFLRNMLAGSFCFFTTQAYENLTPRWAIFLFGCIAALLAVVPFVAYYKGPAIRARSKYSKLLMDAERKEVERDERDERELEARTEGAHEKRDSDASASE
ncbi:hypothetical protein Q5752_006677 [Cryptotrichosporon argae]